MACDIAAMCALLNSVRQPIWRLEHCVLIAEAPSEGASFTGSNLRADEIEERMIHLSVGQTPTPDAPKCDVTEGKAAASLDHSALDEQFLPHADAVEIVDGDVHAETHNVELGGQSSRSNHVHQRWIAAHVQLPSAVLQAWGHRQSAAAPALACGYVLTWQPRLDEALEARQIGHDAYGKAGRRR